jgi:hypothetical protein
MVKELVIHIGDAKAGSTSIQNSLAAGDVEAPTRQILYPTKLNHNFLALTLKYSLLPDSTSGLIFSGSEIENDFTRLAEKIKRSDCDLCILSAENFEQVPPITLRRVLDECFDTNNINIRIIAYVRPHGSRTISAFAENVKTGLFYGTLEEFHVAKIESGRFFYFDRFMSWKNVFKDRFFLRPAIRDHLEEKCIVRNFLTFALSGEPFILRNEPKSNESLSVEELSIIRDLQASAKDIDDVLRHRLGYEYQRLSSRLPRSVGHTRLQMHSELANDVRQDYLKDAEQMDKEFFGGSMVFRGALDEEISNAVPAPLSILAEDLFGEVELRSIRVLSNLIYEMLQAHASSWPRFFMQQRINEIHV